MSPEGSVEVSQLNPVKARRTVLLNIEGLRLGYGSATVVDSLDLAIRSGEISGIVGANGAGKSTLLKSISGLLRRRAGRIEFDGREIQDLGPGDILRAGIAQVAEGHRVFRKMTVAENLRVGTYLRSGASAREVKDDLERIYALFPMLETRAQVRAGALSGGQQQMLAIGQALMASPTLLLMDEPSVGLSPTVIEDLVGHLGELRRTGLTLLVVDQRTAFIRAISERIWVMDHGSMIISDMPAEECTDEKLSSVYLGAKGVS